MSQAGVVEWAVFAGVILVTMLVDRLLFGRGSGSMSFREALLRSLLWIGVSLGFNGYLYLTLGSSVAVPFLVAYVVEKSLSVDNLFVFLAVFGYFRVAEHHQHRVLFWGVFGAVVMRALFIVVGAALLKQFSFMIYVFGAFLVYSGAKLAFTNEEAMDPEQSPALRIARRWFRTTSEPDGDHFFTRKNGQLFATPLFLVLVVVEFTDLLFAVDSVPAVLAISDDLFIVYSSNIFAIMGLRALYFLLAGLMGRFHFLDKGLALVLIFIGLKMGATGFDIHVPNLVSLGIILAILTVSVIASLMYPRESDEEPAES